MIARIFELGLFCMENTIAFDLWDPFEAGLSLNHFGKLSGDSERNA